MFEETSAKPQSKKQTVATKVLEIDLRQTQETVDYTTNCRKANRALKARPLQHINN